MLWRLGLSLLCTQWTKDDGTVRLTVKVLDGSLGRDVTLNYRTVGGTATADSDYTSKDSMLTLTPGDTEATIEVDITDDMSDESAEEFTVVSEWSSCWSYIDPGYCGSYDYGQR